MSSGSESDSSVDIELSDVEGDDNSVDCGGSMGDDVEMAESPAGSVMDEVPEVNANADDEDGGSKVFQKDNWRLKFLPYYNELTEQANHEFQEIKSEIASAIFRRDLRPGLSVAINALMDFIALYGRRFTKTDHINMVKLFYDVLVLKDLDFRVVKNVSLVITNLLQKKMLVTRDDLKIDWKPLFDLYFLVAYKNLERDGVVLFPEALKEKLEGAITLLSDYFDDDASQGIMDRVRPDLCPFDDVVDKAVTLATLFLPTNLRPEEHAKFGATVWFDELYYWYSCGELSAENEDRLLSLFTQLASDCPFYVDWRPKMDHIFDRLIQSCNLSVGGVNLNSDSTAVSLTATLAAFTLGGPDGGSQAKVTQLLVTFEDFFHPSNTSGHLSLMTSFIQKMVTGVVQRVSRERHFQNRHLNQFPAEMRLTDAQLDAFVKSLLPCLNYLAFLKVKHDVVTSVYKHCAFLAPGIILPTLLDLLYPAMENITEPHRLLQTLRILYNVIVPIARDDPSGDRERLPLKTFEGSEVNRSLRIHLITILNNILPGLDVNDSNKCAYSFQVIATIFSLVPIVDCSEAPLFVDDLTEEERELCSATAGFEELIDQMCAKLFSVIESYGSACNPATMETQFSMQHVISKSTEESISERGLYLVIRSLTRNCSTAIFKRTVQAFYDFIDGTIFDSRTAMDSVLQIMRCFINADPDYAFPIFFKYASDQLNRIITDDTASEEELNSGILWYYSLLCQTMCKLHGRVIVAHKDEIMNVLDKLIAFRCKDAFLRSGQALENMLLHLTTVYQDNDNSQFKVFDQPLDKYLPIRAWARSAKRNEFTTHWHIPSPEEVAMAKELLDKYLHTALLKLSKPEDLSDIELYKSTAIVHFTVSGAAALLPLFDGERINVLPHAPPSPVYTAITMPSSVERIVGPDGRNVRRIVFEVMETFTKYMLEHKKNDTKTIPFLILTLRSLLLNKGLEPTNFALHQTQVNERRRFLNDPIRGIPASVPIVVEDAITMLHERRVATRQFGVLTELHERALHLFVKLGTSTYMKNRYAAQHVLQHVFQLSPFLFLRVVQPILDIIRRQQHIDHEEFKGALYILINGKNRSIVLKQYWETISEVWPTIIRAHHSEKPSILNLFDVITHIISESFESFQITYTVPEVVMASAERLIADYDGNVHKALISAPTPAEHEAYRAAEQRINEMNLHYFYKLNKDLYDICVDPSLHWRHVDMAQVLLALLFRRDVKMPDDVVKLYFRLLSSDVLRTRKAALTVVTSWQKIVKVNVAKVAYKIENPVPNTTPGAKWPITYGLRSDNMQLVHAMAKMPESAEEYDSTPYFTKWNEGFYTWPANFKALAPMKDQKAVNRTVDQLSPLERDILAILSEPGFIEKVLKFGALEEKKGHEYFNEMSYQFFYRFFRNYGPIVWPLVEPHLDRLIASKKEGEQRLASEIVSGLVLAAKVWPYNDVLPIVQWLRPRLTKCFETMTDEAENNWCTSVANIFSRMDIRQVHWLYEILTDLVLRSTDSGFHTIFRLHILHSSIVQYEWRVPHILNDLFKHCSTLIARNSQFLRGRVGAALASCVLHDIYGMVTDPNIDPSMRPLKTADLIGVINREIRDSIWPDVLTGDLNDLKDIWGTPFTDTVPRLGSNHYPSPVDTPAGSVARAISIEPSDIPVDEDVPMTSAETPNTPPVVGADGTVVPSPVARKKSDVTPKGVQRVTRALKRTSTPPVTVAKLARNSTTSFGGSTPGELGRHREKAIVITLANSVYSAWSLASPNQLYAAFELLPLFAHFANDMIDDELRSTCEELVVTEMASTHVSPSLAEHILRIVHLTVRRSVMWKSRCVVIRFLSVHIFANIFIYRDQFLDKIREILDDLLLDPQIEVRTNASYTLSGFIQCGLFTVDSAFLNYYGEWAKSEEKLRRHAGVLALSGVVTATPYKVPAYMPDVLMTIVKHLRDPQPIYASAKRALNEFKRTHLDCWTDHKNQFNEDQLTILTNLLVSPNYYV
uniref:Proteasome activator complex subunit 4 n=1 Tax=Panagrellus redivivus TaxID=6233 RepID=A0A7E4VS87_PANRE